MFTPKTDITQYRNIRSTGIRAIILNDGDELMEVALTDGTKDIILGASNGKANRFSEELVRPTNRAASGVKGIKVAEGEHLIGMAVVKDESDEIIILTSNGYGKRTSVEAFKVKGRNGKGVKFMNLTAKNGIPTCLHAVTGDDDLIIITDKGTVIRTHLDQISTIGRDTQGVKIITLNEGHTVASIAVVPRSDDNDNADGNGNDGNQNGNDDAASDYKSSLQWYPVSIPVSSSRRHHDSHDIIPYMPQIHEAAYSLFSLP